MDAVDFESSAHPEGPNSPNTQARNSATSGNECLQVLDSLLHSMCCPKCSSGLERTDDQVHCVACDSCFPIRAGIPLLATYGSSETWMDEVQTDTSCDYQNRYEELTAATKYNEAYRDKREKRWTTDKEIKLLNRLLSAQPHSKTLLNIPCGGGRLSEHIATVTNTLIEADTAFGQLLYAQLQGDDTDKRLWMSASAFHIPFNDQSVDGVVCCRLCHHLPTATERERLVTELLRVARRFVIMTFFDYHSPKNYLRRARRSFDNKPPKLTMTRKNLAELAAEHGAKLVAAPTLAYPFSGHRYALMVKGGESQ